MVGESLKQAPIKIPIVTVVVMSEPCISKIPITTTVFLYDAKEELQLYGTATSNSKQDLRNQRTESDAGLGSGRNVWSTDKSFESGSKT